MNAGEAIIPPKGADVFFHGSFYKISAINKVFIHVNGSWMLSSRSVHEIRNAISSEGRLAFAY